MSINSPKSTQKRRAAAKSYTSSPVVSPRRRKPSFLAKDVSTEWLRKSDAELSEIARVGRQETEKESQTALRAVLMVWGFVIILVFLHIGSVINMGIKKSQGLEPPPHFLQPMIDIFMFFINHN